MEAKNRIGEMKFHLLAVAIGATLTGCSSLKGARFNHEASKSGDTLAGVPFTLNRPVPTVTRTPGAAGAPDRYAIKFEYLPDPNGRFTLQIDPALISSVDFQMTFDTNGSLIETTAKTIDHTGALLTALGKAVAAFGAADTDAPKSESELAQGLLDEGKDLLAAKDARLIDSVKTVDIGKTAQRQVTPADQEAWSRLGERLLSAAAIGQARKSFVYVNRAEYEILTTLLVRHRQARDPSKFPATFNTAVTNAAQLKDQAKVQDIITAYRRMDKRPCEACHGKEGPARMERRVMYKGIDLTKIATPDPPHTWTTIERLKKLSKMKLLIKGITTPEDALLAREHGADGVIISNHGGRAEASGRGTIEALKDIVDAVGPGFPVLIDGGVRRGTDVFKALALGARAVGIGRPYLWGLASFGQAGVDRVLELLNAELRLAMRQFGTPEIGRITRKAVTWR